MVYLKSQLVTGVQILSPEKKKKKNQGQMDSAKFLGGC